MDRDTSYFKNCPLAPSFFPCYKGILGGQYIIPFDTLNFRGSDELRISAKFLLHWVGLSKWLWGSWSGKETKVNGIQENLMSNLWKHGLLGSCMPLT